MWWTNGIPHDRRRTLHTRKRAESEYRPGGAFDECALLRQGGLAETAASAMRIRQGVHKAVTASAALTASSFVQKSTLLKEKWLHGSAADNPSGKDSPHTWHDSPHPSGSSEQRQTMCPQQIATNAMQLIATSDTKFLNLPFLFTCHIVPLFPFAVNIEKYWTIPIAEKGWRGYPEPSSRAEASPRWRCRMAPHFQV